VSAAVFTGYDFPLSQSTGYSPYRREHPARSHYYTGITLCRPYFRGYLSLEGGFSPAVRISFFGAWHSEGKGPKAHKKIRYHLGPNNRQSYLFTSKTLVFQGVLPAQVPLAHIPSMQGLRPQKTQLKLSHRPPKDLQ